MATNLTQRGRTGNNPALLPALPASTAADPVRRQWEEMVREWLEVRLGARGDFFERAVTHRELRQQLDELVLNQGQSAEERRLLGLISALQGQVVALARQFNVVQSLLTTNVDNSTGAITNVINQVEGVANEDVAVFAVDMRPTQTGGCSAITTIEFGANQPNFHALLFDPTTSESADFHTMLPFGWAGRGFKAYVYWGHGASGSGFGVTWEITANSTYDNETVILDFVGGVVVTDVGGTAGNLYIAESAAVPIASYENEEGSLVSVRIYRRPSHVDDTLNIDAALLAVRFALVDIPLSVPSSLDPLNLLQTRFVGASADDESYYATGAPTQSGGTVISGYFDVNIDHSVNPFVPSTLTYSPSSLLFVGGQPITVEFISDWQTTPNVAYIKLFAFQTNTSDVSTYHRIGYYGNTGQVCYDNAGFGVEYISPANFTAATHFAIVFSATSLRVYFNGVKVWEQMGDYRPSATQALAIVGNETGYSSGVTQFKISGFRVRQEEVYTGTSFTPPTAIPAP